MDVGHDELWQPATAVTPRLASNPSAHEVYDARLAQRRSLEMIWAEMVDALMAEVGPIYSLR